MRNIYIYSSKSEIEKTERETIFQFFEKYKIKTIITAPQDFGFEATVKNGDLQVTQQ